MQQILLSNWRASAFTIPEAQLLFDIHDDDVYVTARLKIHASGENPGDLHLDGKNLQPLHFKLNQQPLALDDLEIQSDGLIIPQSLLGKGCDWTLESTVKIDPWRNTALEGLYASGDILCTQCEANGFRKITWFLDRPDILCRFRCRMEAEQKRYPTLLSNGHPIARGALEGSRHYVEWEDPTPKSAYLFACVAGNLARLERCFTTATRNTVNLSLYAPQRVINQCHFALDALERAMRWDEVTYGCIYDLSYFTIVAIDDFNSGAMENKGLNIFNNACLLADNRISTDEEFERIEAIIAHEYFHNYSGNRVTCRDWFQLCLKEGLTVFRDQQFTADHHSVALKRVHDADLLMTRQFAEDHGPQRHAVRPECYREVRNLYTLTVYEKGAELVRMLQSLLGEAVFNAQCRSYFRTYDLQAVTVEDFLGVMLANSKIAIKNFMRWYRTPGTPQLEFSFHQDAAAQNCTLECCQRNTDGTLISSDAVLILPIRTAFVDPSGTVHCRLTGQSSAVKEHLLVMNQPQQSWCFENVPEAAVPSILRGFSAPVHLIHRYQVEELLCLQTHDNDAFNRWWSNRQLYLQLFVDLTEPMLNAQQNALLTRMVAPLIENLHTLNGEALNQQVLLLRVPEALWLIEQLENVNIPALLLRRKVIVRRIAGLFVDVWHRHYQKLWRKREVYQWEAQQIAQRRLQNLALYYWVMSKDDEALKHCRKQMQEADNMTDESCAFTLLVHYGKTTQQEAAIMAFYQRWRDHTLALQRWFRTQATVPQMAVPQTLDGLREHVDYQADNPNFIRALSGAFATHNLDGFHCQDRAGYLWLVGEIQRIDRFNPQMAARMTQPLLMYRRLAPCHQEAMKAQIRTLANANPSADVGELLDRALAEE